jgi:hypothetical protein
MVREIVVIIFSFSLQNTSLLDYRNIITLRRGRVDCRESYSVDPSGHEGGPLEEVKFA